MSRSRKVTLISLEVPCLNQINYKLIHSVVQYILVNVVKHEKAYIFRKEFILGHFVAFMRFFFPIYILKKSKIYRRVIKIEQ